MKANIFISRPRIARITDLDWYENPYYEVMYLDNEDKIVEKHFDTLNEVQKHLSKFRIIGSIRHFEVNPHLIKII